MLLHAYCPSLDIRVPGDKIDDYDYNDDDEVYHYHDWTDSKMWQGSLPHKKLLWLFLYFIYSALLSKWTIWNHDYSVSAVFHLKYKPLGNSEAVIFTEIARSMRNFFNICYSRFNFFWFFPLHTVSKWNRLV